jgi:hypothetical protein
LDLGSPHTLHLAEEVRTDFTSTQADFPTTGERFGKYCGVIRYLSPKALGGFTIVKERS